MTAQINKAWPINQLVMFICSTVNHLPLVNALTLRIKHNDIFTDISKRVSWGALVQTFSWISPFGASWLKSSHHYLLYEVRLQRVGLHSEDQLT